MSESSRFPKLKSYLLASEETLGLREESWVMQIRDPIGVESDDGLLSARLGSYRRLADVFHDILSEHGLDSLLDRVADTLADLIPYDTIIIYEMSGDATLVPVLARDPEVEAIMKSEATVGRGLTGWAVAHLEPVLANNALLDPRVEAIPGTKLDPEALITIPLVARDAVKGALNIYRLGEEAYFTDEEFELAIRFGDAVALALDNAKTRAALERQAQTDSLTGLYNHRFFHERMKAELHRATRSHDSVSVVMLDLDDFKRINDIFGHGVGDSVLIRLADVLREAVRASDVVCRLGGEEFAIIMPSCDAGDALGLATRIAEQISSLEVEPVGRLTVSMGIVQGPEQASNAREMAAYADAAMMTAKARGKDRIVLYEKSDTQKPRPASIHRDVRSIAHLKMLQSVTAKLNRLNDVDQIGATIANELRTLTDYHSCLVYMLEAERLVPITGRGELAVLLEEDPERLVRQVGEGIIGHVAATGKSLLVSNALESEYAIQVPGTPEVQESIVAVPLSYGTRVIGVILISKLGTDQFDDDDVRLLEVLSGHASVALENARLYEAERREAESARALLEIADAMSKESRFQAIGQETARFATRLMGAQQASLWLQEPRTGEFSVAAHWGYVGDPTAEPMIRKKNTRQAGERLLADHELPVVMTPEQTHHYLGRDPEGTAPRTIAVAPLHGVKGWITVRHPSPEGRSFEPEKLRLLAGLSHQASVAMQKAILYREQKESADIANALLEFGAELATAEGLEEVFDRIVEQSARILGAPRTAVCLQEARTGDLVVEASWGFRPDEEEILSNFRVSALFVTPLLDRQEPFVFDEKDLESIRTGLTGEIEALRGLLLAIAPLRVEGVRGGCIAITAPAYGDYEFSERKMRLLKGIAHQAQLAIANAVGFESLESTFLETVEALANALEAKDEYTSSHARWITDMALDVGRELGLDATSLKRLELGALFHDIGKIGVPSSILLKPGPLTEEEWEIIKTHPEVGARILAPIDRLADVRPVVRHCHEHFDGSGYPDGKREDAIPMESRIILVVDAFHAMTSDRPYRKAMPLQEACRRLRENAGSQFDPEVVEAFMRRVRHL
jgi:diguanylate cyclase (GGDEF)-like protein